jgi:hypothetical protein
VAKLSYPAPPAARGLASAAFLTQGERMEGLTSPAYERDGRGICDRSSPRSPRPATHKKAKIGSNRLDDAAPVPGHTAGRAERWGTTGNPFAGASIASPGKQG